MPSASAKLEKQASQEATDPFKQVLTLIDHKRRNLEKRKAKLDGYRTEQKNGKELKGEQLAAVAKYDEVCKTLEFAMDMSKSVLSLSADHAKVQKKQQRKEQLEKTQSDLSRIRELLIVQDVMHNMGNETVRADFLAGRDGAISVTQEELTRLDELYPLLSPKREDGAAFAQQVTSAAEHLLSLMEGRSKELLGSTYTSVRDLLQRINICGYFEQNAQKLVPDFVTQEGNCTDEGTDTPLVDPAIIEKEVAVPLPLPPQVLPPVMAAQPVEPPQQQPIVAAVPVAAVPVVAAEAASYFSAPVVAPVPSAAPPPQFPPLPQQAMQPVPVQLRQQHRPIAEVIGQTTSSFNFLQESQLEMESPSPPNVDLAVMLQFPPTGLPPGRNPPAAPAASAVPQPDFHQTIPTQTFTNQSFSVIPQQGAVPVTAPSTTTPASAAPHIPTFTQQPTATPPFLANAEPPPPIPMPPRVMQEDPGKMIAPQGVGAPPPSFAQAATYSSQAQGAKPQSFVSGAPPGFTPQQKIQQAPPHLQQSSQLQQTSSNQHQQVQQQQPSQFQPIPSLEQAAELDRADEQASWTDAGGIADGDEFSSGGRAGGYRGRGGRGRGRGGTNGYSGRSRGQQNGGGGRSGGYQGRNLQESGERSFENGLTSQRDYSSNFKRSGAPPRDRDGPPRDREGAPNRGSQSYRGGSGAPFRGSANNRNNLRGGGGSVNQGGPRAQHVKQ